MKNFLNLKTLSFCLALSLLAVSCKKESPATPQQPHRELILLCGSSFVEPTNKLCAEFTAKTGIEVVTSVAGSEDFLPLVKTGQRGDILVTHDPYLDYVKDAGVLFDSADVGFVAPVLAVQKGNPKKLNSIEDLTRPGIKIAFSNPDYSTCGEMVAKLFEKKSIKDAVMKNVENRLTKGHSQLGTFLKTQVVDAVIMWNGVAHTFSESVDIVPTPYEYDNEIKVHVIGLNYSPQPELVKQFVEMAKTRGPEIYAEFGYTK
ncbi:MAG: substrate-binding domain-containing protein [Sedimentisphaerales bacterium]|nr:substrate-binding domain-containing protein [Sedimentisphaerales bacterium]